MSESSEASGNIVLNPSKAALPGLSVTPGLNPTETTASGVWENISLLPKKDWLVIECSMIGSANKSSALAAISAWGTSELIRNPTIVLTPFNSKLWSADSCLLTTSPRTSRNPGPDFGVASTRVTCIVFAFGVNSMAVDTLFEQYGRLSEHLFEILSSKTLWVLGYFLWCPIGYYSASAVASFRT